MVKYWTGIRTETYADPKKKLNSTEFVTEDGGGSSPLVHHPRRNWNPRKKLIN